MVEDKLTQDQRIRLEAVAQANQRAQYAVMRGSTPPSVEGLLHDARAIEKFIAGDADAFGRES